MKVKSIIFDMDGVLVDADKWHFDALNLALERCGVDRIPWNEHLDIYKGIPTKTKLEILTNRKGLDRNLHLTISDYKQEFTQSIIKDTCVPDLGKIEMLQLLKRDGYKLACCSNAISSTIRTMLDKSGLLAYFDLLLSNEDVSNPKPSPEIYLKALASLALDPNEVVIVEDSDVGKAAAKASHCILCSVSGPEDVNYYKVISSVKGAEGINVVIPAAGQGKRFSEAGYHLPKPLIDVFGRPMVSYVLDNFKFAYNNIILMQKSHIKLYEPYTILSDYTKRLSLVEVDGVTEGAACTVLLAKHLIDNNNPLIIANSDQFIDFDISSFVLSMEKTKADCGILTFKDSNPKWSFAECVEGTNNVIRVAEKEPISDNATVGIYYFKSGSIFVKAAEQMIRKNIRTNNEFYVCPVFNEVIELGHSVVTYEIPKDTMYGLGTPEDLDIFKSKYKR